MAAAGKEELDFRHMDEAQLRQWVEANPGRVNDRDWLGYTPLYVAVCFMKSLPLTVWLLGEKGADVNATISGGVTPLHLAPSLDILTALMNRGCDPTHPNDNGWTPLMGKARHGSVENVARLLQDPRVRGTVNVQDYGGNTALYHACCQRDQNEAISISMIHHLLQAGVNPAVTNIHGETPLAYLRQRHPTHHAAIALLEQVPDAEKASLLVKARRLVVVSRNAEVPSYLQGRVARGQPLPDVVLMPVMDGQNKEEGRKLRTLMAFTLGMEGGPENLGMPGGVFVEVMMDLLMPSWDPLRRKNTGTGPPVQQN